MSRDSLNIRPMLEQVSDPAFKTPLLSFYDKNLSVIQRTPGVLSHHHDWDGGWADHTAQVMSIGLELYDKYKDAIGSSFTLDDVLIVSFVHDLDKLSRYKPATSAWAKSKGRKWEFNNDNAPYEETSKAIAEAFRSGIMLTDAHIEAINHHHGGFSPDISSVHNAGATMTSLSTLLHCADMLSTYLYGKIPPNAAGNA